jgi:hypothetical protein
MIHGKRLAVVVAYDMYLECAEGQLDPNWKLSRPVDFHRFCEKLAIQMLQYSPKHHRYPGDDKFRMSTQLSRKRRGSAAVESVSSSASSAISSINGVGKAELDKAEGRLCGFLDDLLLHEASIKTLPNKSHGVCLCCGKQAYTRCTHCPNTPVLHMSAPKGRVNSCFIHYHNTASFGKWRSDYKTSGGNKKQKQWQYPDAVDLHEHSRKMERLHASLTGDNAAAVAATTAAASATRTSASTRRRGNTAGIEGWNDRCL